MKFTKIPLVLLIATAVPHSAKAEDLKGKIDVGFKTENLRPNGGVIVSKDPVLELSGQITHKSGLYGKVWSTIGAPKDTEVRLAAGVVRPCLDGLTCRLEVGHWFTPKVRDSTGDVNAVSAEVSGNRKLGKGRSLGFSVQAEHLAIVRRPNTQILRVDGIYAQSVLRLPVRLSAGLAYRTDRNWLHAIVGVSTKFKLSKRVSLTPSALLLAPLNQRDTRKTGFALGLMGGLEF
jgi:hypothetical protein